MWQDLIRSGDIENDCFQIRCTVYVINTVLHSTTPYFVSYRTVSHIWFDHCDKIFWTFNSLDLGFKTVVLIGFSFVIVWTSSYLGYSLTRLDHGFLIFFLFYWFLVTSTWIRVLWILISSLDYDFFVDTVCFLVFLLQISHPSELMSSLGSSTPYWYDLSIWSIFRFSGDDILTFYV